jgi:hypothetical protein
VSQERGARCPGSKTKRKTNKMRESEEERERESVKGRKGGRKEACQGRGLWLDGAGLQGSELPVIGRRRAETVTS